MRKMICMHGLTPEQEDKIRAAAPGWSILFGRPSELDAESFRDAEVVCGWCPAVETEGLRPDSKLRWVQTWSAGVDKLPLDALAAKGVILTDASGIHPIQMTETAFAMMLAFARNVHTAIRNQAKGVWDSSGTFGELYGQTIGIVGAGAIGGRLARIAKAFGMRTLGVRRSGRPDADFDAMTDLTGLHDVLSASDYVVNALPLTAETRGLFGPDAFRSMKRTARFLNIGRGATVDTDALVEALRDGTIAGAGLDVTDPEPLPADHPLWKMDNVIITPHTSGLTNRYKERITELFVFNLQTYLREGRPARNIVDYERRY
ncbi:3-phosphoglycerate dehydrogenase [Paenibacillus cisolokensis]|uniref:3-phosphoglycerate dehydrogenase n=1 Tax=Paenibacillus cisolokensis TaxID=1658519 RepID=A0ABQ4NBX4_9BACL|nr:D-2-hydroxyacid dehydrogenase [Paenibacillus cisolokensis]GIQ65690.1 3-phosphoglycerate dehydrogenase [Paenibacillus cisolokensis]